VPKVVSVLHFEASPLDGFKLAQLTNVRIPGDADQRSELMSITVPK